MLKQRRSGLATGTGWWVRRAIFVLATVTLLASIWLLIWARLIIPADRSARFALDSDDVIIVSKDEWIGFRPRDVDPIIGVIFYPDKKAEPAGYAPMLRELAARGFLVVITPMPLNLALFAPERARRVMSRFSDIQRWVIAGHGLGGMTAAMFAERHTDKLAGLMLWASSPALFSNLSKALIPVISIYATADELTAPIDIERSRERLPADTSYVAIQGGDHWNFGDFSPAAGTATISRDRQQAAALDAAQAFLERISPVPVSSDDKS
jgi:hypothetical protein